MNNTLYVGLSRQMTLQRDMDVVANNIANGDTAGFKVESLMVRTDRETPTAPKSFGATQPDAINFVYDVGVARDFSQGALKQTGAPFDLGLQGDGFFQLQTAAGPRFTRDGRFALDAQGQIVDESGDPLMGDGGPITVDPQKPPPSISADGVVSQAGQRIGKVGVFRFGNLSALSKTGSGQYDAGAEAPLPATNTKIEQGSIEGSNVNPIQMMTKLIAVSRAYESIANMMDQTGSTSDQAIQRLGRVN